MLKKDLEVIKTTFFFGKVYQKQKLIEYQYNENVHQAKQWIN